MLILFTPETALRDLTQHARERIAQSLKIPTPWVTIRWSVEGGNLIPAVDVIDPNAVSPDVPEDAKAALPGIRETLARMGVTEPEKHIAFHTRWLVGELTAVGKAFA